MRLNKFRGRYHNFWKKVARKRKAEALRVPPIKIAKAEIKPLLFEVTIVKGRPTKPVRNSHIKMKACYTVKSQKNTVFHATIIPNH